MWLSFFFVLAYCRAYVPPGLARQTVREDAEEQCSLHTWFCVRRHGEWCAGLNLYTHLSPRGFIVLISESFLEGGGKGYFAQFMDSLNFCQTRKRLRWGGDYHLSLLVLIFPRFLKRRKTLTRCVCFWYAEVRSLNGTLLWRILPAELWHVKICVLRVSMGIFKVFFAIWMGVLDGLLYTN